VIGSQNGVEVTLVRPRLRSVAPVVVAAKPVL